MPDLNLVGRTIGRFEILTELGRGGMAVVYRARQLSPNRLVALKVLPPELSYDRSYIARFRQEADSAAALEHPNIVPIYAVDEVDGLHYIAMKLIDGETLKEMVQRQGALSIPQAAALLEQVASALDYAHARQVIHRDIKPSNIMVDSRGWVYLTDFGLARGAGAGPGLTVAGTVMGTPEYMSPEQAQGLPNVGPPTDVYALGVVLYELLTGHMPFRADTPMGMLVARLQQGPTPPRDYRSDLPMAVEDVVMRALARRPEARFASAGELVAALKQAAGLGAAPLYGQRPLSPPQGTPLPPTVVSPPRTSPPMNAPVAAPPPAHRPVATPPPVSPPVGTPPPRSPSQPPPPTEVVSRPPPAPPARPAAPREGRRPPVALLAGAALVALVLVGALVAFALSSRGGGAAQAAIADARAALAQPGGIDRAISAYQTALQADARNAEAHTGLALIYQLRDRYTDAEQSARAAISADPKATLAHAMLAESLNGQGRYDEALDAADAAVNSDPQHPAGHASRALILADRAVKDADAAMLDEAVNHAEQAIELAEGRENLLQALAHNARGVVYWYQYQFSDDEAMVARGGDEFNRAIGLQGQIAVFHSNLGYFYNDQGAQAQLRGDEQAALARLDLARIQFERAQEADPEYGHAHAGLGWNLYYLADYQGSLGEFDKAIELNPQDTDAYIGKSTALRALDPPDYDGAIAVLQEAVEVAPYDPNVFASLGWAYMSKGFGSEGDAQTEAYRSAAEQFQQALDQNDRFVSALTGLGWAHVGQGDYEAAIEKLEQSLAIKDDQSDAHFGLGWAYYNSEAYDDAEPAFRRSIELAPDDGGGYYWLGLTLEQLGRIDEAREAYQTAVDKGNSFAQQELDRLSQ